MYDYYEIRNYVNDINQENTQVLSSYDAYGNASAEGNVDTGNPYTYNGEYTDVTTGNNDGFKADILRHQIIADNYFKRKCYELLLDNGC